MQGRSFSSVNRYRYGFNGQEKDVEIDNDGGNIMTAMYWEYDSRIGRRWNIDPVKTDDEGSYTVNHSNPIKNSDKNGDKASGANDPPDINFKLMARIAIGGKSSGSLGFSVGLNQGAGKNFMFGVGFTGSLNMGGLGTTKNSSPMRFEFATTGTMTSGWGQAGPQSLQTVASHFSSSLNNTFKNSGTLGLNFVGSSDNRGQITSYFGFRIGDFSAGHNNDLLFKTDHYHGANINIKIGSEDGPNAAIWNDMYNGRRVNHGPNKTGEVPAGYKAKNWGGKEYNVMFVKQNAENISLNSGRTFFQMNFPNASSGTTYSVGFGFEGPKETRVQQWLHYGKAYPQFELNEGKSQPFFMTGGGYGQ